jgi:hypothetical protein
MAPPAVVRARREVREHLARTALLRGAQARAQEDRRAARAANVRLARARALVGPAAMVYSADPRRRRLLAEEAGKPGGLADGTLVSYAPVVGRFLDYVCAEVAADAARVAGADPAAARAAERARLAQLPAAVKTGASRWWPRGPLELARLAVAGSADIAISWLIERAGWRVARGPGASPYIDGECAAVNTQLAEWGLERVLLRPAAKRVRARLRVEHARVPERRPGLPWAVAARVIAVDGFSGDPVRAAVALFCGLAWGHVKRGSGIAWATWGDTLWSSPAGGVATASVAYTISKGRQGGNGVVLPAGELPACDEVGSAGGPRGLYRLLRERLAKFGVAVPAGAENWRPPAWMRSLPIVPWVSQSRPGFQYVDPGRRLDASGQRGLLKALRHVLRTYHGFGDEASAIGLHSLRRGGDTGMRRAGVGVATRLRYGLWSSVEGELPYDGRSLAEVARAAESAGHAL